jgi:hypothetical protein
VRPGAVGSRRTVAPHVTGIAWFVTSLVSSPDPARGYAAVG